MPMMPFLVEAPSRSALRFFQAAGVFAGLLATSEAELGQWLFNKYLPGALADGQIKPALAPQVVVGGLAWAQKAVDVLKHGVSGKKIVFNL